MERLTPVHTLHGPDEHKPDNLPPWGWVREEHPVTHDVHVFPTYDLSLHSADHACRCLPLVDDEVGVLVIHNAFDGREAYELGRARRH